MYMYAEYICRRNYRTPGENFFMVRSMGPKTPQKIKKFGVKCSLKSPPLDFQKMFYISWCSKIPPTYIIATAISSQVCVIFPCFFDSKFVKK